MRKTPPKTLKRLLVVLLGTALLAATLAVQAGETVTYVQTDIQGNPVTKTDSSGKVIWRQSYAPYGRTYQQTDPDGPGYTGHRHDTATGLVYMQARYYDPKIGRFLSPDPVTFSPEQPDHFNLYWYANDNPLRFVDPDGRDTVGENIDSAAQGCGRVTCAFYAVAHAAWAMTGDESLSQVADKGWSNVTTGDKIGAIVAVASVIPVGRVTSAVGKVAEGAEAASSAARAGKILAKDGTEVTGFTKHGINRAVGAASKRAGTKPQAILDALKNPTKVKEGIDIQGRPFKVFTGKNGRVVVNPKTGKIISTNPLSRDGANLP